MAKKTLKKATKKVTPLKVGDWVKVIKNNSSHDYPVGSIKRITYIDSTGDVYFRNSTDDGDYCYPSELVRVRAGKTPKVNFLLKYDLDEDPIEEFETMAEVEARIKVLIDEEDSLQKDSIVVYSISKKVEVEVKTETKITYKK